MGEKVRVRSFTSDMRPAGSIYRWVYSVVTANLLPIVQVFLALLTAGAWPVYPPDTRNGVYLETRVGRA